MEITFKEDIVLDAGYLCVDSDFVSMSLFIRHFGIDYNEAVSIMDKLEGIGIVGEFRGSKNRELLVSSKDEVMKLYNNSK